ncbi:cAMP receptor-like G-protein coupled receptor [Microdochium nivale]|nr:cAMP receptor-like G-protein coupled receptor [Microdochium nivale]
MADLSREQLVDITSLIERVGSVFSLFGSFFIIITFSCSSAFHQKPINRLVFYASFGNVLCNVGTLMAGSYTKFPDSVGCQLQGALIQMFMPADTLWTLAMGINVWLTFYQKYDAIGLRKMEKWYFLLCYGVPLVPAVTFAFVENQAQGRVYGDAKLWCWITPRWTAFRFALFYGPVWIAILTTLFIYARAGRDIYNKRRTLRDFGTGSGHEPDFFNMTDPFSTKTTEIIVTSEPASERPLETAGNVGGPAWRQRLSQVGIAHSTGTGTTDFPGPGGGPGHTAQSTPADVPAGMYSVTISADAPAKGNKPPVHYKTGSGAPTPARQSSEVESQYDHRKQRSRSNSSSTGKSSLPDNHDNTTNGNATSSPLPPPQPGTTPFAAATAAGPGYYMGSGIIPRPQTSSAATTAGAAAASARLQRGRAAVAANSAAWSYTKCAMLFFTAMLITWLPSTGNRLYNLASGGQTSTALEYMTAIVLPIQGFWNCVIYCVTSSEAVAAFFQDISSARLAMVSFCCSCGGGGGSRRRHHHRRDRSGPPAQLGGDDDGLRWQQFQNNQKDLELMVPGSTWPNAPYAVAAKPATPTGRTLLRSLVKGPAGGPDRNRRSSVQQPDGGAAVDNRKNSASDSTTELRPSQ